MLLSSEYSRSRACSAEGSVSGKYCSVLCVDAALQSGLTPGRESTGGEGQQRVGSGKSKDSNGCWCHECLVYPNLIISGYLLPAEFLTVLAYIPMQRIKPASGPLLHWQTPLHSWPCP